MNLDWLESPLNFSIELRIGGTTQSLSEWARLIAKPTLGRATQHR
jgi:hypothetical protein